MSGERAKTEDSWLAAMNDGRLSESLKGSRCAHVYGQDHFCIHCGNEQSIGPDVVSMSAAIGDPALSIWNWQREHRRPAWDEVFMMLAEIAATRSTCDRGPKQRFRRHRGTGACIASEDRRKVSLGYNGSVPGQPHCDDADHEMVNGSCVRTIHAEENAILNATFPLEHSTIYTTTMPCYNCAKRIITVGIKMVVYQHEYKSDRQPNARDLFAAAQVELRLLLLDYEEMPNEPE